MENLAIFGGKPVRTQTLPIFRLEIEGVEFEAVRMVLASGQISRGARPLQFEEKFCEYVGAMHGVVVSSGTAALHLAIQSLDLPVGSEIVMPSLSFVATAFAAEYCGLNPVFVDIESDTFNLDPQKLSQLLEARGINSNSQAGGLPKAIVPVHYGGRPYDVEKIKSIADEYGLRIIEDAAHAVGATYGAQGSPEEYAVHSTGKAKLKVKNLKVGCCKYSDLTCFSFFATKNITGGEGGIVTTNDKNLACRIRRMKAHGIVPLDDAPKTSGYYDVKGIGYNFHLSNINIALLEAQLQKIDDLNDKRKANAKYLSGLLNDLEEVHCPQYDRYDHVYHLYTITAELDRLSATRDELIHALLMEGIQVGVYYRPIHLFTYFREKYGYKKGDLPVTETVCDSLITLPMYPCLTKRDIADIAEAVHKVIKHYRK